MQPRNKALSPALALVHCMVPIVLLVGPMGIAQNQEPTPAQVEPKAASGPSSQQEAEARVQYQRLSKRREEALIQYNYIIPGKRTQRRREEAFRQYYPHPKDWAPRFFAIQEKYPGTVAAGRSLVWIVRHWKDSELDWKSRSILLKSYLGQPFLYEICHTLGQAQQPRGKSDLLFLFQHSPVDRVKAHACQALCELGMDQLQSGAQGNLRETIEEYVQLLETRFAAVQIAGVGGAAWSARYRLELNHLTLGQKALAWQQDDLDGVPRSLAETRGQVVLLYFWKSSSRPARLALPHVNGLMNKYSDKPFRVFGISGDLNRKKAKRWQQTLQVKFPNWHVPSTTQEPGMWGVTSWPNFYVLSPKGRILAARANWEDARKAVVQALDQLERQTEENKPIPSPEGPAPGKPPAPESGEESVPGKE
ncbi:MAG: TlpA disulfide reductase family protein, partial [Planctomycetota bacterium]|nr:TlpA disulfide reductase family protein [Planctomycetota bacterium]